MLAKCRRERAGPLKTCRPHHPQAAAAAAAAAAATAAIFKTPGTKVKRPVLAFSASSASNPQQGRSSPLPPPPPRSSARASGVQATRSGVARTPGTSRPLSARTPATRGVGGGTITRSGLKGNAERVPVMRTPAKKMPASG
ncbi:unnamed protein product, partial [Pylaiella littoralis]